MKKLLTLTLAVLMLLTALIGCEQQTITFPDGTQVQLPGTKPDDTTNPGTTPGTTDPGTTDPGTTDPGTTDPGATDIPQQPALKDDEVEKTTEHIVGNGKFVFYEHKYDYADQNLVLMDVKNETDTNYTLTIHYTFYDAAGEEIISDSKIFDGIASGMQKTILLWEAVAFDSYSYTIETTPFNGVCVEENFSMKLKEIWVGRANIGRELYPALVGNVVETNFNSTFFYRCATVILFDNTGKVYGMYSMGIESCNAQYIESPNRSAFCAYIHKGDEMIWPEELTGDLRCIVVQYCGTDGDKVWHNSDLPVFNPDGVPPPGMFD